ncbi:methionyl-tRNA formyltransferase [Ferriphaselus sp. R-1]|uniref:methionyl-tRNA formyltransferase n=1 Tax=Ferriphaselus sp. R-1 TaxID=1485544 RepID=UPI0005573502|nr:methionyl-tRNA formyltransferase [Ferriphaselus sp. R-1]
MKLIFAGTPHFAAAALQALLDAGHQVVAVLTQPDRPAGRGMQLQPSPVKQLALQHGLPVLQPLTLKHAEIQQELAALNAEVMVVAAYGLILPQIVLDTPRFGCLNIHASLLPRWRGAAPIQRAILAGDAETGITIMQMDAGLDTGDMLLKTCCPITVADTAQTLHDKLATQGAEAIVQALAKLAELKPEVQNSVWATYAAKLNKAEAQLDWSQDAEQLARAVRGYNPVPVANSLCKDTAIKLWQASVRSDLGGIPGTVLAADKRGIVVACGKGALNLEVLQRPGGKALPAAQFLQGFPLQVGDRFGS